MQLKNLRFKTNVSTLLSSFFIMGDLRLLGDSFYTLTNERSFLLMRCKYVSAERLPSSRFKGVWVEFMWQASKQMVPPVGASDFGIREFKI